MRRWMIATGLLASLCVPASAGEIGDQLAERLYDGTAGEIADAAHEACYQSEADACFARGMVDLVGAYETLAQSLYRHGAVSPGSPGIALLFGRDVADEFPRPANPDPEPLTYDGLRAILEQFENDLTGAGIYFQMADIDAADFVIPIDVLKLRVDIDGNGKRDEGENIASLLGLYEGLMGAPSFDTGGKVKTRTEPQTVIGFDRADAVWLAGYVNVAAAPVDLILAHDFSDFFDAYMHQVFPKAGLPMQDHMPRVTVFLDASSDVWFADIIAAIHTLRFPVTDSERLAGVLERLKTITALSRRNWELILAETDDDRELVPSPSQTSLIPGMVVTQDTVDAWLATLDTVDAVLDGELLVPHWRFDGGFDLAAYFTTATETDLVLLMTGQGALPYIKQGPVADAQSFAEANEAFGADWLNYAFWFN